MNSEIFEKFGRWRVCESAETTRATARELGAMLPADCTLALHGGLGAGKTTFVGGLAEAFGVREPVTSPSYNIYAIYEGRSRQLVHMDAYRLPSPEAAEALMLEEFMRSPWCWVVEWPEKIGDALPPDALHLDFEILDSGAHRFRVRA
ncbi:MAG: tRNA (adenosine(37)-N6)-threonylcarbamoyltransferase complex ATPase subunit type 1 TsaE [Candidatus Spyradosoma sp.]